MQEAAMYRAQTSLRQRRVTRGPIRVQQSAFSCGRIQEWGCSVYPCDPHYRTERIMNYQIIRRLRLGAIMAAIVAILAAVAAAGTN